MKDSVETGHQAFPEKAGIILETFEGVENGLTEDSLAAALALERDIVEKAEFLQDLKEGKIEAVYTGDKTGDCKMDLNKFVFSDRGGDGGDIKKNRK